LPRLLDEVVGGQSFVITRHGRAVARLVPAEPRSQAARVIDELRTFRAGRTLGDLTERALREEGRS